MNKIVFLPLDERPCTFDYPRYLANIATDINFVSVPKNLMGEYKKPGNIKEIDNFLLKECKDASIAIIAIDSLLYGGIVPSRLHYYDEDTLIKRLEILKEIKKINPGIKIFAYHLIMRCPSYSSDSEEPPYYALCGYQIHMLGKYEHLSSLSTLDEKMQKEYDSIKQFILDNDYQKYVDDYLNRRSLNTKMNLCSLSYVKEKIIDFLIVPQDDSAPYGYTAKDQIVIRKEINRLNIAFNALMYPDADGVGNTLLARAINYIKQANLKIYVRYNTCNNGNIIPNYEDRPVSESIKYQILAAGGFYTTNSSDADIILMVNLPLKNMGEARRLYDDLLHDGETDLNYTVGRNLVEYVEYIKYLTSINQCVAIADIAYANGGDLPLFNLLKEENLLFKVDSYAGWNTAANTLATCIPLAMISKLYGKNDAWYDFMGLRYLEDVGYMSYVRFKAFDYFKGQFDWGKIDGVENGIVSNYIKENLTKWAQDNLTSSSYQVQIIHNSQPWNRFFETKLIVKTIIK
ncbi:MAG: DUF4127 family protein [Erysipelotrichaceae bacterium]|nr:DUF4127 family protein [Erysipelotrichaceae bacterium]